MEIEDILDQDAKTSIICSNLNEADLVCFALDQLDAEYCEYIPFIQRNGVPSKETKKDVWLKWKRRGTWKRKKEALCDRYL